MSSMERPPSIFAEVAEKSKAMRAQMDRSTVARAAKRVKDGEDQHAERSIKFAADFERLGPHSKGISVPTAPDPDMQNPRCELEGITPKVVVDRNDVTFKAGASPTMDIIPEKDESEHLWDSLRRLQEP